MEHNHGVACDVHSCKYHEMGDICKYKKIKVTSSLSGKHFCQSFENKEQLF